MATVVTMPQFMGGVFLGLALTLLLPACGRSVMVTVVDERLGTPIARATVVHSREEWRMLGILPLKRNITQGWGQTDANGQIGFKDVRDSDIISARVEGAESGCTWFNPLWPVSKTKAGYGPTALARPNPKAPEQYQRLNADAPPDRLTLPVQRESKP